MKKRLAGMSATHTENVSTASGCVTNVTVCYGARYACAVCKRWFRPRTDGLMACHSMHLNACYHCNDAACEPERDVFGNAYTTSEPDPIIPMEAA